MFGLGKPRSKLGKFIDDRGLTQGKVALESGLNRMTLTELCKKEGKYTPTRETKTLIVRALKRLTGESVSEKDVF